MGVPQIIDELSAEIDLGVVRLPRALKLYVVDLIRVLLGLQRKDMRADDERIQPVVVGRATAEEPDATEFGP